MHCSSRAAPDSPALPEMPGRRSRRRRAAQTTSVAIGKTRHVVILVGAAAGARSPHSTRIRSFQSTSTSAWFTFRVRSLCRSACPACRPSARGQSSPRESRGGPRPFHSLPSMSMRCARRSRPSKRMYVPCAFAATFMARPGRVEVRDDRRQVGQGNRDGDRAQHQGLSHDGSNPRRRRAAGSAAF